jgi:serine O-acetyltransferase
VIGQGFILHGDNCIGNDGITDECPKIGDNVELGVGAKIIGGVTVADNVVIGAGAIVVKDIEIPGAIVGGIPAKVIR